MIAHLVGGGPMDGRTLSVEAANEIHVPFAMTLFGPFYVLKYKRESADPDGLLGTYRFAGWPEELGAWMDRDGSPDGSQGAD
jgi:hypothetical protein